MTQCVAEMEAAILSSLPHNTTAAADDTATSGSDFFAQRVAEGDKPKAGVEALDDMVEALEQQAAALDDDSQQEREAKRIRVAKAFATRVPSANEQVRTLVSEVVRRSQHYLTSPEPRVAALVLDVIGHGTLALNSSPDTLHPLLHDLWQALLPRLHAQQSPAITRIAALKLLARLVAASPQSTGSFLARRFADGVWPQLRTTLEAGCGWAHVRSLVVVQGASSMHRSDGDGDGDASPRRHGVVLGTLSLEHQAVVHTMRTLRTVAPHVQLRAGVIAEACDAVLPYLSTLAPVLLQTEALATVQQLFGVNPGVVWHFLFQLVGPGAKTAASERSNLMNLWRQLCDTTRTEGS